MCISGQTAAPTRPPAPINTASANAKFTGAPANHSPA